MSGIWRTGMVLAALLALSACGLGVSKHADDPNYKAGRADGCWTATSRVPGDPSTVTRNEEAYKSDEAYRAGWNAGYNACRIRDEGSGAGMPDTSSRGTGVR
ncbi:hypothetical protein [uncultured Parvibaculum sp.]|uniref:hypothetical protein n=1 Tax=uncultured Parvibaculum sp. TaxID=291828 RepID=UPI0030D909CE